MTPAKCIFLSLILSLLCACQKKEKAEYDNSFIQSAEQLIKDIDSKDNEGLKETIKGFDEKSRFTQEFAYIYQDRQILSEVSKLVDEGEISEAEQKLDKYNSVRGFSPELTKTHTKLKAAKAILNYEAKKPYESVAKAKAALLKAQNLSTEFFAKKPYYKAWSIGENRLMKQLQRKEDALVESSLLLHYDIACVSDRRIIDTIQIQAYSLDNSRSRKSLEDYHKNKTLSESSKILFDSQVNLINSKLKSKSVKQLFLLPDSSFEDALTKLQLYARNGKTAQFISALTELNQRLEIDKPYLQELSKEILLNKGWYKSSRLNKPYLDLSKIIDISNKSL